MCIACNKPLLYQFKLKGNVKFGLVLRARQLKTLSFFYTKKREIFEVYLLDPYAENVANTYTLKTVSDNIPHLTTRILNSTYKYQQSL